MNVAGNLVYINSSVLQVSDPQIICNQSGAAINNCGIIVAQNQTSTGAYILVNTSQNAWSLKAGNGSTVTLNQDVSTNANVVFGVITGTNVSATTQFLSTTSDSVSAPGYSWSGDVDTGIYHPAANQVAITTAGTERLRVDGSGTMTLGAWNSSTGSNYYVGVPPSGSTTNTSLGLGCLYTTSATNNTAIGYNSLKNNSTGGFNTAVGSNALLNTSGGIYNTAIGVNSMQLNISGGNNTAIGYAALYNNLNNENVAIGRESQYLNYGGASNVAVGNYSLRSNLVGGNNVALGHSSLFNTTASDNVAIGRESLYSSTTPSQLVAIGGYALRNNTTGTNNVAVGYVSQNANTVGTSNTSIGYASMYSNTIGTNNTALGRDALYYTTGSNNVAIGYNAGKTNTGGSGNIFIGSSADGGNVSNTLIVGTTSGGLYGTNLGSSSFRLGVNKTAPLSAIDVGSGSVTASSFTGGAGNFTTISASSLSNTTTNYNSVVYNTTTGQLAYNAASLTPAGVIQQYAGSSAPAGYLLCDGSAVSRTTYTGLFTVLGTTYGSGDGSTTFNLPNLKGRIPVGYDAAQTDFNTLGKTGGVTSVTLTESQIPSHSHTGTTNNGGSHTHTHNATGGAGSAGNPTFGLVTANGFSTTTGIDSSANELNLIANPVALTINSAPDHTHTFTTTTTGGGQAHTNLQPYITVNYIIKT